MGTLSYIGDSLRNLVANLGTGRDKAASSFYALPCMTDQDALNAYRGAWLPRKIIDIIPLDACRNWRSWQAESQQVSALEREEARLGVAAKVLDAMIKARLFGGAAIYIGTGDSDPSKPLRPEGIKRNGIRHLNVLTRRILKAGEIENDPESPLYGKPKVYTLTSQLRQVDIHPSRLVVLQGAPHPDPEMASGQEIGWGDSVLTAILDQIKQADGTAANIASLVFEAKIDVIKIPGFMASLMDPTYEQQVLNRLSLAATAKGINGCLILDAEEEYEQKNATFSGLTDVLMVMMQLVSGAADIPITRLLGQSPGGLNATGDSDIRNYYDRVKAMQELTLTPALSILDDCLVRSALGTRPPEVFYNWRSLWQTSEKERADIGKITAETIKAIDDTGLVPSDVMAKVAVNMLTESGTTPGLESEMAEWTAANPEGLDPEATGAEAGALSLVDPDAAPLVEATDAAPRTLYVRRDVKNAEAIAAWAREQGIPEIADDLHVTIVYSRQPFDWIKAGNASDWSSARRDELIIPEGGPRAVEPLGGMSAVLLFASSQLAWRHAEIVRAGASHDFPDYTVHISLSKAPVDLAAVVPYRGPIILGPEIFEEIRED